MLAGVEETARWTIAKIAAMRALREATTLHLKNTAPKVYSHELVDLIFELPYCRIHNLTDQGFGGRQTASRHLKQLAAAGVLNEIAVGREKLFLHPKLMQLLTREGNQFTAYS